MDFLSIEDCREQFLDETGPNSHSDSVTLGFEDKQELVIRGVLDKLEKEGRSDQLRKMTTRDSRRSRQRSKAELIYRALFDIFSERWSIVVYDTYEAEAGCRTPFHYAKK
jgi:DNA-binding transcriptional regulator PaaX